MNVHKPPIPTLFTRYSSLSYRLIERNRILWDIEIILASYHTPRIFLEFSLDYL